jgi:hypothetical protein
MAGFNGLPHNQRVSPQSASGSIAVILLFFNLTNLGHIPCKQFLIQQQSRPYSSCPEVFMISCSNLKYVAGLCRKVEYVSVYSNGRTLQLVVVGIQMQKPCDLIQGAPEVLKLLRKRIKYSPSDLASYETLYGG